MTETRQDQPHAFSITLPTSKTGYEVSISMEDGTGISFFLPPSQQGLLKQKSPMPTPLSAVTGVSKNSMPSAPGNMPPSFSPQHYKTPTKPARKGTPLMERAVSPPSLATTTAAMAALHAATSAPSSSQSLSPFIYPDGVPDAIQTQFPAIDNTGFIDRKWYVVLRGRVPGIYFDFWYILILF